MIILDGARMDSRADLHAELREKLSLPDYYGGNLDALNDCLGERREGYLLGGDDRRFAEMLYDNGGTIGILKAYEEGDRVKLSRDAFGGFEGEIIRLDRRKGRAQIRYTFDQTEYKVWVGYELMK